MNKSNNSIVEFRKKRKNKKFVKIVIALVILLGLGSIVYIMRDTIFEPFRDIVGKVTTDENVEGFPVKLTASASYSFAKVGENFVLLTDTYLYSYNANGSLIANVQHGYQNPVDKTNEKRILLYDKGAHEFSLLNRSGTVFEKTLDDNIVYGTLSSGEYSAIVTNSTRYANYLYVFNGDGTQVFRWASVDNKIMQTCFSADEKKIYVTALGSVNGELATYLYCFDMSSAEGEEWKTQVGNGLPFSLEEFAGNISVVSSESTVTVNKDTGEIISTYGYKKIVKHITVSSGYMSVLFSDSLSTNMALVTLNENLEMINTITLPAATADIYTDASNIYALVGAEIIMYDRELNELKRIPLEDEYSGMIFISNNAYFLGYDVVQRVTVN